MVAEVQANTSGKAAGGTIVAGQTYTLDLRDFWYRREGMKPFPKQERFLFAPHGPEGCPPFQYMMGGRGLSKTRSLSRKLLLLSLLNAPANPELPVWGALCGRTQKEVWQKILPALLNDVAEIKRETGIDWTPTINKGDQTLHFPFGVSIYLCSYEKANSLNQIRGYTLGFIAFDEVDVASISCDEILEVATATLRDDRAKHSCMVLASTPKGLRGFARRFHEANLRGDRSHWLVTGTCYDNPYLAPRQIAAMKKGMSKRLWQQEGLGVVLSPTSVVFGEYREDRHVRPYVWQPQQKTLVLIDWGTSHAYLCVVKVAEDGTWWVVRERKETDTTYHRFRGVIDETVAEVRKLDGRAPYAMCCDGAVKSEKLWLGAKYMGECPGGVLWLSKDVEQRIDYGIAIIASRLDPLEDQTPKLFFAATLDPTTDEGRMGMRGAMATYCYATMRTESGEVVLTSDPSKRTNSDHPIDALRYGYCCLRYDKAVFGGQQLKFLEAA